MARAGRKAPSGWLAFRKDLVALGTLRVIDDPVARPKPCKNVTVHGNI